MGWLSILSNKSKPSVSPMVVRKDSWAMDGRPMPLKARVADVRSACELVHRAAVNAAKAHGIPPQWLSFKVVTTGNGKEVYLQLQVVIERWDEYLAAHTYAFELVVMKHIRDANVNVSRAVRAVLFRVAPSAGCPYQEMPKPHAWTANAINLRGSVRPRAAAPSVKSNPATDTDERSVISDILNANEARRASRSKVVALTRSLLAAGDANETRPSILDGFAPTEPSRLRKNDLLSNSAFNGTPSSYGGFASTQPYVPLMEEFTQAFAK
jgi:hypothetical protein